MARSRVVRDGGEARQDLVLLCDADHGLVHDLDLVMSRRGGERMSMAWAVSVLMVNRDRLRRPHPRPVVTTFPRERVQSAITALTTTLSR